MVDLVDWFHKGGKLLNETSNVKKQQRRRKLHSRCGAFFCKFLGGTVNKHVNALTGIRGSILSSSPDRNQVTIVGDVSPNYLCLSLGDWSQVSNEKRAPGCLGFIGNEILPSYVGIFS